VKVTAICVSYSDDHQSFSAFGFLRALGLNLKRQAGQITIPFACFLFSRLSNSSIARFKIVERLGMPLRERLFFG
jgi:hypothetical protein